MNDIRFRIGRFLVVLVLGVVGMMPLHGGEGDAVGIGDAAKKNWIDHEVDFAAKLVMNLQYEDLFNKVIENIHAGRGWDDQPLSADLAQYLDGRVAKTKLDIALRLADPAEKIDKAGEALGALQEIKDALPDGRLKWDAHIDLIEGYFLLAGEFRQEVDKAKELAATGIKDKDDIQAALVERKKQRIIRLREKIKEYKTRRKNTKSLEAQVKKEETEYGDLLKGAGFGPKAIGYYNTGMADAKPLLEKVLDDFDEVMVKFEEASKEEKAKYNTLAEQAFFRRIKLQHAMERAYSNWIFLLPRGSAERLKKIAEAVEFFELMASDYEYYLPTDKLIYLYWFVVLSGKDDPLFETGADGNPIPPVDKEADKNDPMRYLWPSTLMEFLFRHHFVEKLKIPGMKGAAVPDPYKIRALHAYAEALIQIGFAAFDKAKTEDDADRKKKWQVHAVGMLKQAETILGELIKPQSKMFKPPLNIDLVTRMTTRLHLRTKFAVRKALLSKEAGRMDSAREMLSGALGECSLVTAEGGAGWKYHAQKRVQEIQEIAKNSGIEIGPSVDALLADAEDIMRAIRQEPVKEKQAVLRRQANDKYREALDIAKAYPAKTVEEKRRRSGYLLNLYTSFGVNALMLGDFELGYICAFEVVQEFNPTDYPRDVFAGLERKFGKCLQNLRYAAGQLRKRKDTAFAKKLYVDALLLSIARQEEGDGKANPDLVVILINELKGLGLFEEALEYISEVPKHHVYFRSILLMAAGICQTRLKQAQKEIGRLDAMLAPAPKKPLDPARAEALKAKRAELVTEKDAWAAKARTYAERYLAEMKIRPPLPENATKKQADTYDSEDKNIPAAYMIPISIAFAAEEYNRVNELVDEFATQLATLKDVSDDTKNMHLSTAYYLKLIALLRIKNRKTAPLDEVWAQMDTATGALAGLEKADTIGERKNQAYLLLGAGWNNLANRYEHKKAEVKEAAEKESAQKKLDAARLNAAEYFVKAEGAVYEQLTLGLVIGGIYSDQGMYDKAEAIYNIAIRYWADSLFTEGYLFRPGKTLDDLKRAPLSAEISSGLQTLGVYEKITSAEDVNALLAVFNEFVESGRYSENKDAYSGILLAAKKAAEANAVKDVELLANIEQGLRLLKRSDIATARELRQRLNRIIVEASYPKTLVASSVMATVPEAKEYDVVTGYARQRGESDKGGFAYLYPSTPDGRLKALLMKWFHDPRMVVSKADTDTVQAYRTKLEAQMESAQSAKRKGDIKAWLGLFDPGLRVRMYGIEERGKILSRSFSRAKTLVDALFSFHEQNLKLDDPKEPPTKEFLERCREGLLFNQHIFNAQKLYVDALMAMEKPGDALKYLEKLVALNPTDKELKIKTASAESLQGFAGMKTKSYTQEQASLFMRARMRTLDVYRPVNKQALGSALWWDARMQLFENDLREIELRHATGGKDVDYKTPWMKLDKRVNKMVPVPIPTEKTMKTQGQKLRNEIVRLLNREKQGALKILESKKARLSQIMKRLGGLGIEKRVVPEDDDEKDAEDTQPAKDNTADAVTK